MLSINFFSTSNQFYRSIYDEKPKFRRPINWPVIPNTCFFHVFRFLLFSMFFDRFRLNGYHHVFPLIEIYRFMQLPSRTDDINFIFDRFSVFFENLFFVFDDFGVFCYYRSKVTLPSFCSPRKPVCMQNTNSNGRYFGQLRTKV